jgi:hypothetical protein
MLPSIANMDDLVRDFEEEKESTKTFDINLTKNIVGGKIDGLSALKQSIYLRLSIEADQHIIYPYTYGLQTVDLIGKPYYYVVAVLPGRIKDALLKDDRITEVDDFEFEVDKNTIAVRFTVTTIYGAMKEETVVMY